MLESILPTRYRVSKGFVIDADGCRSDQVDLLIYDRHFSPVLLDVGDYLFVPAEAVFAVLEIKQEMNRDTIKYATDKVAAVRNLRRTSAPIPNILGKSDPITPKHIIGGLMTMDSGWNPPLSDSLDKALHDFAGEGSLDMGCALRGGSFVVNDGSIMRSSMEDALIFFVLRLLKGLQKMASPPAIDYNDYARVLDAL